MAARLLRALLVGLIVGGAVIVSVNAAIYVLDVKWDARLVTGFWGLFYGTFSAVAAFGLALALTRHSPGASKIGWWVAALTFGTFGLLTTWWIVAWGLPPFTLEGAWIYPLAIVPLVFAVFAARKGSTRNRAKGRTSET